MFENPDGNEGSGGEEKERRYKDEFSNRQKSRSPNDAKRYMREGPSKAEPEEIVNMILKKYDWYDVFGD